MPLVKTIDLGKNGNIWLWKIEETLEELSDIHLNKKSQLRLNSMKSLAHQKGFLAVRQLLKIAGYTDRDLSYTPLGKPLLSDKKHISISHSFEYATLIISDKIVGIDIEKNRDKIKKIASRFIGTESLECTEQESQIRELTRIWAAKESLFKTHIGGQILFKDHLFVTNVPLDKNTTSARLIKDSLEESYEVHFLDLTTYTLAYAIQN
ncbi:MAG: 4'-phosphopantetheinyl transferase superfamily protein [Flavobacteriaceae bacterium]